MWLLCLLMPWKPSLAWLSPWVPGAGMQSIPRNPCAVRMAELSSLEMRVASGPRWCPPRSSAAPCFPPTANSGARRNIFMEQQIQRRHATERLARTLTPAVTSDLFLTEKVT